jgi:hypothetical protein
MANPFTPRFVDLVRNTSTTVGTGDFALGAAVNGYASFAAALSVGDRFYYSAIGVDKPAEREVGRGTLLAGGIIAREPVSGAKTAFTSGTKSIALIAASEWFDQAQALIAGVDTDPALAADSDARLPTQKAVKTYVDAHSSAGLATMADRAALAAANTSAGAAMLREAGREGMFAWDGSDLSAYVTVDSQQGVYVAPASAPNGASGAWVRKFDGDYEATWFGAVADDATDASGPINAALVLIEAHGTAITYGLATRGLHIEAGLYYCATSIVPQQTSRIVGDGGKGAFGGSATVLRFAAGQHGIDLQYAIGVRAPYILIKGLHLKGAFTGTEAEVHGINADVTFAAENVYVEGFEGDGFNITASSGPANGYLQNANCFSLTDCTAAGCRNGLFIQGGDTNAGYSLGFNASYNRQWGVWDSSFLGNTHIACHSADNGITSYSSALGASVVSYSGNHYALVAGQEAGGSTNAPSGTTADNTWWYYTGAGAASGTAIPDWVSGMTLRAGGAYHSDNANASNVFTGNYAESGQGPSQFSYPTLTLGGSLSSGVKGNSAYIYNNQGWLQVDGGDNSRGAIIDGETTINAPVLTLNNSTGAFEAHLHSPAGNANGLRFYEDGVEYGYLFRIGSQMLLNGSNGLRLCAAGADVATLAPGSFNLATGIALQNSGTTLINGAGVIQAAATPAFTGDVTKPAGALALTIANSAVTYAKIQNVAASSLLGNPTGSAAAGSEISLAGGLVFSGTTLSAAGALTPTSIASTGAITTSGGSLGYATGAGGTVTQATSKSTGVTLNKPCGAIAMNGAALAAAGIAEFTVTNSAVAANDTINLNLASGATTSTAYRYWVSRLSAGSFRICVENRSAGSLSEALVLNFAVVKAVNA